MAVGSAALAGHERLQALLRPFSPTFDIKLHFHALKPMPPGGDRGILGESSIRLDFRKAAARKLSST